MVSIECQVWWSELLPAHNYHLALLDPLERGRYDAYRREDDRLRFLTGRVLAKSVVAGLLAQRPTTISFDATCPDCGKPHGRPTLPGGRPQLSITHSGDRVGLALCDSAGDGAGVGIDVESASRSSIDDLIRYALNDDERQMLEELPDRARHEAFFVYWSRKEALMKASGLGLKLPLRAMTLSAPGEPPRLIASEHPALAPAAARLVDLDPGEGYQGALAVLTEEPIEVDERWWTP